MFNSQRIHNDPKPWTTNPGQSIGYRTEEDPWFSEMTFFYDPRPKYDNNPNPILLAYRADIRYTSWNGLRHISEWQDLEFPEHRPEHVNHARKVLERIVNVYG